jgi:hypothetical protein
MSELHAHERPCSGCPYRKDCPSGVWAEHEYRTLAEYDNETPFQPQGVFLCHDGDRENTLCRGWLDTHPKEHLLALRFAISLGEVDPKIMDLPKSSVPCFSSGREAMEHGIADILEPGEDAEAMQEKLIRRHPELLPNEWREDGKEEES